MKRLLAVPLEAPRLVLGLLLLITVFFGVYAVQFEVDSSTDNLLPLDDPERSFYLEMREEFGTEEITLIGLFADDVFTPAMLAEIDALSKKLAALDGVAGVLSLTTAEGAELGDFGLETGRLMKKLPRTQAEADAFRELVLRHSVYTGTIVSADARAAGISVVFEPMSDKQMIQGGYEQRIRDLVAGVDIPGEVALTGIPTLKVFGAHYLEGDILKFLPLSVLVITLVLAWTYRSLRGVLIPLSTVLVGVVWTVGLMVLTGVAINLGTVVLPPLLMAVGVAYSIHMMSRYYDELKPGRDRREVIAATLEHVRLPVGVAALTTLAGFATFILTPIPAIREFGIYSSFGLIATLIAAFTILPAALVLLPSPNKPGRKFDEHTPLGRLLGILGQNALRRRNHVLFAGAAICGIAIWGITFLRVETDFLGFFDPSGPIRTANSLLTERLAGTQAMAVVIDAGKTQGITELETLQAIRDLQDFIDRQPGVDKTLSIVDYLEHVRGVIDPGADPFPDSQAAVGQILMLTDPRDLRSVLNPKASRANLIVRSRLSGSSEVGTFVERVNSFAGERFPAGITVRPTGTLVLLNRSADTLAYGQITGLWQVFAVLLLLMCIMFLSLRVGLLSLVPNLFPVVVLFGVMGWTGISLNISTTLIAAMAIGIAIDDTIHYLGTFSAELRHTGDQTQAMLNATRSVGAPMVVTSVALAGGFLVISLSNFGPVRDFGVLSSLTMVIALLSDLLITPAVLMTTKIITLWDLMYLKLGPEPQKQIPLFAGLSDLQAKIVVLMARLTDAKRGDLITRAGEREEEMYVLLAGHAEVRRGGTVRTFGRGDVVGEMGLVRGQPRSADVAAIDDVEYLVLDRVFLQRIRGRYPRIGNTVLFNLARILSDRLDTTTGQLAHAAMKNAATQQPKEHL